MSGREENNKNTIRSEHWNKENSMEKRGATLEGDHDIKRDEENKVIYIVYTRFI